MLSRVTRYRWAGSRSQVTTVGCLSIIAIITSFLAVSESSSLRGTSRQSSILRRNRNQSSRTTTTTATPIAAPEEEFQDYEDQQMICPQFTCPPLPKSCVLAEFLVFVYEYRVPRRLGSSGLSRGEVTLNVHCETCQYCVDAPTLASSLDTEPRSRRRRDVDRFDKCKNVGDFTCPMPSEVCTDVRMLDVVIDGKSCDVHCPACYESPMFQIVSGRFLLSFSTNNQDGGVPSMQ